MLSEEDKARIRAEEEFREAVRDEIAGRQPPRSFIDRLWVFLNSQFGAWFLATVLVGGAGYAVTWYTNRQNAQANERIKTRTEAREDGQTVAELLPHLGSDKPAVAEAASALLSHLSKNGINERLAESLRNALADYQRKGSNPNALESQRRVAEASVTAQDERLTQQLLAESTTADQPPPECLALKEKQARRDKDPTWATSPQRVYFHIADESQRETAEALAKMIRDAGILVPGIQNVGRLSPKATEVRYFNDEDRRLAERIVAFARDGSAPNLASEPKCPPLYARKGHVELFFARPAA